MKFYDRESEISILKENKLPKCRTDGFFIVMSQFFRSLFGIALDFH